MRICPSGRRNNVRREGGWDLGSETVEGAVVPGEGCRTRDTGDVCLDLLFGDTRVLIMGGL